MNLFFQLMGNGIVQGVLAMLYAAGFGFVYRSFRVFHIAIGAQFVFSCYAFYFCAVAMELPLAAAVCGAVALSVLFALSIEWTLHRPFFRKGYSSGVAMIASPGVMIVVENALAIAFGNEVKTSCNRLEPPVAFTWLRFTRIQFLQFFVGLSVFALIVLVHTMFQITLLHLAFLGFCLWNAMRQKCPSPFVPQIQRSNNGTEENHSGPPRTIAG